MKKFKVIALAAVCAAVCGMFLTTGKAEAKTYKFYANYVAESYITQGEIEACKQIEKETNGKIKIKVYPGGQLGSYEDVISEVKAGTIEFGAPWLTKKYDPRLDLLNLPCYAPMGYKQYAKICFADNSKLVKKMHEILKDVKVHSIGAWPEPYACFVFAKGKKPKNFEGFENKKLNIRVPGMPLYRDSAITMGYQTLTMDVSEIWNAMQTGQIDGATGQTLETTLLIGKDIITSVDYNKFHCPPAWVICNQELWDSFTPAEQKIINKAFTEWGRKTLALMEKKELEYAKELKKLKIEIHEYSPEAGYKLACEMRKKIWPKYYNVFGKEFLQELDKQVAATKPGK